MATVKVVYDCHLPEVMGYPELGYLFVRGGDAFLMWRGYFSGLMGAMWRVYGYDSDPADPARPNLDQVPLLREWNEAALGRETPYLVSELAATARAFRLAVAELGRAGANLAASMRHGEALAGFLDEAVAGGQSVSVEEWWG